MMLRNNELTLSLDGEAVRLESFDISGYAINAHLGGSRGLLGQSLHGITLGQRDIKIEGYIASGLEENRRLLAKICTQDTPFYIVDGDYRLEVVARRGPELSCERRFLNKLLKFTLLARSVSPLWQSAEELLHAFDGRGGVSGDDNALRVTNVGDVSVGFLLEISMRTSAERIMISKGGESITIARNFAIGDKVFIDTRYGKRGVKLLPSGASEAYDITSSVSLASSFFELDVGENRIDFSVITGLTNMTLTYSPCYLR